MADRTHLLIQHIGHLTHLFKLPDRRLLRGANLHIGIQREKKQDNQQDAEGNDTEKTD